MNRRRQDSQRAPAGPETVRRGLRARQCGALCALLILLLGGCGPPQFDSSSPAQTTLRRGISADPESLDPQHARSVAAAKVLGDIYEPLLTLDAAGRPVAGAASRWEESADGLRYRFFLREDARWSNGDPVRAEDFVRGLRSLVAPETGAFYAASIGMLQNAAAITAAELPAETLGARAVTATELELTLERPAPELLAILSHPSTAPRHASAPRATATDPPASPPSNGAYRLVGRVVSTAIELEKNPYFHAASEVAIDRVRYVSLEDEMAEFHRFRAGELDVTSRVPASMLEKGEQQLTHIAPYLGVYYLAFNLRLPPAKDAPGLRRALSLSLDRELITESITRRGETPAQNWVPPGIAGYTAARPRCGSTESEQRIAMARQLYREAGYGADNPLSITLRYNTSEENRRIAVALQSIWREALGIDVELLQQEFKVHLAQMRSGLAPGLSRGSWIADYPDPMNFLAIFASGHPSNPAGYSNPAYDELLRKAAGAATGKARFELLRRAEAVLLNDQPVIPVYFYVSKHLVQARVRGWEDNALDYHYSRYLSMAE